MAQVKFLHENNVASRSYVFRQLRTQNAKRERAVRSLIEDTVEVGRREAFDYISSRSRKGLKETYKTYLGPKGGWQPWMQEKGYKFRDKRRRNPYPTGRYETGALLHMWSSKADDATSVKYTSGGKVIGHVGPPTKGMPAYFEKQEHGFYHPDSGRYVPGMHAAYRVATVMHEYFNKEFTKRIRRKQFR